jgi:tRNA(Glu) U13 pseudouridine synthase TruD
MKSTLFIITLILSLSVLHAQQKNPHQHPLITNTLKQLKIFAEKESKSDSLKNHPLGSSKEEDFLRRDRFYSSLVTKLNSIKRESLSFNDEVNIELLLHMLNDDLSQYKYKAYLNPVLADEGFQTALAGKGKHNFEFKKGRRELHYNAQGYTALC